MTRPCYPKERYPQGHPDLAISLNNLGSCSRTRGPTARRGAITSGAGDGPGPLPQGAVSAGTPRPGPSLSNLGDLLQAQGLYGEAKPFLQQAVDMQQDLAEVLLAATSEAEAMNYLAQLPLARDLLISVCLHVPESDEANYARVWRGKAAVARMLQRRQAELFHRAAADPAARRDIETWRDVRGQLARLLLATADGRDHPERLARLQQLTADKERLERQLAEAIPEFARHQALEHSPHTKLVEALPEHTVVLDLVELHALRAGPADQGEEGGAPDTELHRLRAGQGPAGARGGPGPGRADR